MGGESVDIDRLREDIEKLILLEEVAERRQQMIEERLEQAVAMGLNTERIRDELNLSKESLQRLLDEDPPALAERLGISKQTAEDLAEPLG